MMEKPEARKYYDWYEVAEYMEKKHKIDITTLDILDIWSEVHNGFFINIPEPEELADWDISQDEREILFAMYQEFGKGPYYFWW